MTWWDFIYKHMISGTATEIGVHINAMNKKLNYMPNNNTVEATVQRHLPLHADGRIKPTSNRKQIDSVLHYDPETRIYSKFENGEVIKNILILKNERAKSNVSAEEKITMERVKDLGSKHKQMLDVIEGYAIKSIKENIIKAYSIEKTHDIDYLEETKDGHNIYEVKSYPESIYTAIGQLLFYKGRLETRYKTNNINMFIVGNFKIPEKYNKVLKDTSIKYKNIKEFKK